MVAAVDLEPSLAAAIIAVPSGAALYRGAEITAHTGLRQY